MAGATPRTIRLQDLTVDVSLSGVAQGDLFFRGSSKWNNLAAGTVGNLLATGGSGANPSWASRLTYASSGSILTITDGATTDVPLVVNGVTSQSGDLAQFKVNGTTLAKVTASGCVRAASGTASNPSLGFENSNNNGFYQYSNSGTGHINSGELWGCGKSSGFEVRSTSQFLFSSTGDPTSSPDTGLKRSSAGVVTVTNGSTGFGSLLLTAGATSTTPFVARGIASQSATLIQLQGESSTTAGRAQAEVDTAWVDSTDATRKARLILRAWDTSAREVARGWSDGAGRFAAAAPASAPTDAQIGTSQVTFYLDESGHNLKFRVLYSDGTTFKTGTVALV